MRRDQQSGVVYVPIALGAVALVAAFWTHASSVEAQTVTPAQQIAQLSQQVAALERRVAELEKGGTAMGSKPADAPAQDARLKQLEARLAAVEKKEDAPHQPVDLRAEGTSVTAPFTVVDAAGKPVMRVTEGGAYSRGAYFYGDGAIGSGAYVGTDSTGGGRMYVAGAGHLPEALMGMAADGPVFQLSREGKRMMVIDKGTLAYYGPGGSTVALFGSKGDRLKGYLELNDSNGTKMIEAGSLDSHKGYVLASPYKTSTAVTGDPSVLKGGGK